MNILGVGSTTRRGTSIERHPLIGLLAGILVVLGVVEARAHRVQLRRIPVRIHVNGTRGKSSVARLITAGLRAGGKVTCAKTTGTLARMILPDGSEYPVYRASRPNVIEQVRIVSLAASMNAEVLVIECMALQPRLQWLSEDRLVRATHGVITNARADHLEVMGPEETDVALALAGMTPQDGKMFTAERDHLGVFAEACADRGTELIPIGSADVDAVRADELEPFSYVEHAENLALALRVCEDLGVERTAALRGMQTAQPDPGAMLVYELEFFGRRIVFVNGFAANDPESTERIWELALARFPELETRIAVYNCRADRPERSAQLGESCAGWTRADRYLLVGSGTYIFARASHRAGIDPLRLAFGEEKNVHDIFEQIVGLCGASALVMGLGNIGGPGLELVSYFRNRSRLSDKRVLRSLPDEVPA